MGHGRLCGPEGLASLLTIAITTVYTARGRAVAQSSAQLGRARIAT